MLLLVVADQALLFTYINTGAPGNIGDAGLYLRSSLYAQMQEGLLDCMPVQLAVNGELQEITPYLVGNGAFSLSNYMQKNFDVKNQAVRGDPLCVEFNRRLINARRCSERAFGLGLKIND
jgi:hypothetical protein